MEILVVSNEEEASSLMRTIKETGQLVYQRTRERDKESPRGIKTNLKRLPQNYLYKGAGIKLDQTLEHETSVCVLFLNYNYPVYIAVCF